MTAGHYQPGPGFSSDLEVNGFISHHQSSERRLLETSNVKLRSQKYFQKSKFSFNLQSIFLQEKLNLPWSELHCDFPNSRAQFAGRYNWATPSVLLLHQHEKSLHSC